MSMLAHHPDQVFYPSHGVILLSTAMLVLLFELVIWFVARVFPDAFAWDMVALGLLATAPAIAWSLRQSSAIHVGRRGVSAPIRGTRYEMEWPSIKLVRKIRVLGLEAILVSSIAAPRDALLDSGMLLSAGFRNACEVAGPDHPLNVFIRAESGTPNRPAGSIAVLLEAMLGDSRPGAPADSGDVIQPTRNGRVKLAVVSLIGGSAWLANELWGDDFFRYVRSLPDCTQMPYWLAFFCLLAAAFACASFVCARRGMRILRSGQSPPPDSWVFFTTRVRRGRAATLSACGQFAVAAFFALLVTGLCFALWSIGMVDAVQHCA